MQRFYFGIALAISLLFCLMPGCREVKTGPQRVVANFGKDYKNWTQITKRRVISVNHGNTEEEIYANIKAYEVSTGKKKTPYPAGAAFVMIHYKDGELQEYAHLMKKMTPGYDPDNSNWRYTIVKVKDWTIEKNGRLEQCVACHYRKTKSNGRDFIPLMQKDGL